MKAIITKVQTIKSSKHGGKYIRAFFKDISIGSQEIQYSFDCYLSHTNSARFLPYLKCQAMFDNINIIEWNGKKVVNGNCNFQYIGMRH